MKFKATSDFRNTHKLKVDGKKDGDLHIAKGDTFEADVQDPKIAELIAILGHSGRIIDSENQPVNADRIDREVKAEKAKAEAAAKLAAERAELDKQRAEMEAANRKAEEEAKARQDAIDAANRAEAERLAAIQRQIDSDKAAAEAELESAKKDRQEIIPTPQ